MGYICYDVRCPNCAEAFYETTELYDPNKMTTGDMLRFKKKYGPEGYNWSLPFSDHDMSEAIVCVECGGPLAPSGKVKVEEFLDTKGEPIIGPAVKEEIPEKESPAVYPLLQEEGHILIPIEDEEGPRVTTFSESENNDSIPNYLKQENCSECGRFFAPGDPWEEHLAKHTPEVRAQILKKIEPVVENPTQPAKAAKKPKSQKGQAKLQAELVPESDDPLGIQCPMCEASFAKDKQGDYDAHFKTHDLGGVQQAVRQ